MKEDRGTAVTVAPNGDVVLTGYFAGTVKFGAISLTNPIGNYGGTLVPEDDVFLARFTSTGTALWAHNFTPPQPDGNASIPYAVATDAAGNIALGGELINDIDFGNGPLAGNHSLDAFVARFTSGGAAVWSGRYGGAFDDRVRGVVFDPSDGVVAAGMFTTNIGPLTSHGIDDGFVASFAP